MCGGGGLPAAPSPAEEAAALIAAEEARARIGEEQRAAQAERDRIQLDEDTAKFGVNVGNAQTSARDRVLEAILGQGLETGRFEQPLDRELQRIRLTVPELDANPGSFFAGNITDKVLGGERNLERSSLERTLEEFAAPGFARTSLASTADDDVIAQILLEQFDPASNQLLRALQRGNLTDAGFTTGTNILEGQRSAASSRLQALGGDVLETGRGTLRDIADAGFSQARGFDFGDRFDPGTVRTDLEATTTDLLSRLGGDIRGALGGDGLFNIPDILSRAGISQGVTNPIANADPESLANALASRETERSKKRGLGQQGVF